MSIRVKTCHSSGPLISAANLKLLRPVVQAVDGSTVCPSSYCGTIGLNSLRLAAETISTTALQFQTPCPPKATSTLTSPN